jgi:hypothetical protein
MNREKRPTPNFPESHGGDDGSGMLPSEPGLCVTVISTTPDGTIAALNAARCLAKDLGARITLLKMEVVPLRIPLDEPPVSLDFVTKQECSRVLQSSAREVDVTIRTCLCHDRDLCLRRLLRRRALVVIGGRRRWWASREEKLEQILCRLGYHVIFINGGHKQNRIPHFNIPVRSANGAFQLQRQFGGAKSFLGRENFQ